MAYAFDEFVFDEARFELWRSGVLLHVDAQVLELLAVLLANHERLVTKDELIEQVWRGRALGDNVISVCVAKLRKALGGSAYRAIGSMYGRGYRFLRPVTKIEAPPRRTGNRVAASRALVSDHGPYVGRSVASARLQRALELVCAGQGSVCALLGEAGIGKTRAAQELEARAREAGVTVVWGRWQGLSDAPPLWPLVQLARACGAALPPDDAQVREARRDTPDSWELRAEDALQGALSWIDGVLSHIRETGRWLWLLEDVQWADSMTLQLLPHLVAQAANLPLLLVFTVREMELPTDSRCRRALDYVLGHRDCARIPLARLTRADVCAYTRELFGTVSLELDEAVFLQSEGNPFFMVELLRPFIGLPAPEPSALALSGPALEIVRQRLRGLEPDTIEVLGAAAVIGRSFDLGLLGGVTGREPDALLELLDAAMAAHVIVAAPDSAVHFTFGHDLIRVVLTDGLPLPLRAEHHLRVASAMAARESTGERTPSAELAYHLLAALPRGDALQAIDAARRAAQASARIGAYSRASTLLRRALTALELLPSADPVRRCQLLFGLALCERGSGEPFGEHFADAVTLAREQRLGGILSAAGRAMSGGPGTLSMPGAASVLEAALQTLSPDEHGARASVLAHLSWTPPHCTHRADVQSLLARAEHHASFGDAAAMRTVLRAKLFYAGGPADHDRALAIASELEHAASELGPQQRARWSLGAILSRIVIFLQRGELVLAQSTVEAFGVAVHALQHAELIWHHERMGVVLRMNLGEYAWAKGQLTALTLRAERMQLHGRQAVQAIDWGVLNRRTAATTGLTPQRALAFEPSPADAPSDHAYKLRGLVQLGAIEEARTGLSALPVESLRALPPSRDYLGTLAHLAFVAAATGSRTHARVLYELISPYAGLCVAGLTLHCYGAVSYFLAQLAWVLGEHAKSIEHFEAAIARHAQLGLQPLLSESRYELARALLDRPGTQDRERARGLLAQARATASQLSMHPLCAAIDRLVTVLS